MTPTHAAIAELYRALEVCETNESINRKEAENAVTSDVLTARNKQADLEASNAAQYRQAIAILEVIFGRAAYPIWPEPKATD